MKFALALMSLFTGAFASSTIEHGASIPADSKAGLGLLSKSRRVDEDAEVDVTWVAGFDIKFQGCHHVSQWNEEVEDEDDVRIETKRLIRFRLCPTGSCSSESGGGCKEGYGDYIVDMNTYVESFLEMKGEYEEQVCEAYIENNCACEDNGDDQYDEEACESNCLYEANMSYCINVEGELEVNEYLECGQFEPENNDDAGRRLDEAEEIMYYLGPYCANQGGDIHLGLFTDETCTDFADDLGYGAKTTYATITGGLTLPYSSKTLVDSNCWSCTQQDDNEYYNQYPETSEFCDTVYTVAGKCEENLYYGSNEASCTYLEGIKMTRKNGIIISGSGSKNKVAAAFIGIFAVSFLLLGSYVYYLKSKLDRGRVHLDS